ncbi:MAG: hypothetical protein QW478_01265 [Candidatus Micrarchaeaceae archaeon]
MIYLICGYKGSGKDTFFKSLNKENDYKWIIYSKGEDLIIKNKIQRLAFADDLKILVIDYLKNMYPEFVFTLDYCEQNKDKVLFNGSSFRDYCILIGKNKVKEDKYYWVNRVKNKITNENIDYFITDFRFPHEYFSNSKTIRVYRSMIKKPEDKSELYLDNFLTDYLVIPENDDIISCLNLFPQYRNYIKVNLKFESENTAPYHIKRDIHILP